VLRDVYYFASGAVAKYCDEYVCVCVCVCLFVSVDISGTTHEISTKFLCMLHMAMVIRYVLPVL